MSADAAVVAKPAMKPNQAFMTGRINYVGTFEANGVRIHETRLAIAAADAYSMPGAVMLQSSYKLGGVGEDWKGLVEVTGFPDRFTTGQGEVKQTARNTLRVVE